MVKFPLYGHCRYPDRKDLVRYCRSRHPLLCCRPKEFLLPPVPAKVKNTGSRTVDLDLIHVAKESKERSTCTAYVDSGSNKYPWDLLHVIKKRVGFRATRACKDWMLAVSSLCENDVSGKMQETLS